jgi:4-alpha-glucanotransferase
VDYESADVWAHPKLFKLDANKRPKFKAGVPPDYFSRTGQLWGNPVYDWKRMQSKDNYAWFINRIAHNLELFDCLRIDHFRGLAAYWEVPAKHKTAIRGQWIPGPGSALLNALYDRLPFAQLFAEDLGFITPDVRGLMQQFELPGMAVLQFGFNNPYGNVHCAHNIQTNTIVYTGTHDNNTSRGWFSKDLSKEQQKHVFAYIGHQVTANSAAKDLIRLAWQSPARVAIVPMQDLLNLDHKARMNFPGKASGNWGWRMKPNAISLKLVKELAEITHRYGRN